MHTYKKNRSQSYISKILALMLLALPVIVSAQQTVVMPHNATDSITVSRNYCYTILDPGGLSNYTNNEDSWLLIHSTSGAFNLKLNYETGINGDCNDYIDIYQGIDSNAYFERFCASGSSEVNSWSSDVLIHFRSNAYASFRGFEILLSYPNTIYNWAYTPVNDSTVTLTWDDYLTESSQWTITYFCDEDTLQTITSNTNSATITGLRNNTYYAYYIENNASPCMLTERQYFIATHPDNELYAEPYGNSFNLSSGSCYTVNATSGPGSNTLSIGWINVNLLSDNSVGCYADGWSSLYYFSAGWSTPYGLGGNVYYWDQNTQPHKFYFPQGSASFSLSYNTKFQYNILWENNRIITPTVSNITATSATISWTDTTASTQWTVRYTYNDGNWITRTVSSPTITLTGLEPARQYLYTIEGNVLPAPCITPYRHAFITTPQADTLIMPYRKADTITLLPGNCYTVVDAGGADNNYFHSDFAIYTLQTASHNGFRLKGWYNITSPSRLYLYYDNEWHSYEGSNSDLEIYASNGSCTIGLLSGTDDIGLGFVFDIIQLDSSITNLQATAVTANSATISWSDPAVPGTSWQVHYGYSEDNFSTVTTSSPSVNLTNLTPGTQYVYYITRLGTNSNCHYSDRKAFITDGLPNHTVLMPYRGTDTLHYTPGACYTIYDAGGSNHDYFNYDTSTLVIVSSDGSDFFLTGEFDYESIVDLQTNGYDGNDILFSGTDRFNSENYNNSFSGDRTWFNNNRIRVSSQNGFLRIRWRSNERNIRKGFTLHLDRDSQSFDDVRTTHVNSNSASIRWDDNSGYTGPWYISYTSDSVWTSFQSNTNHATLSGLLPSTLYRYRISQSPSNQNCDLQSYTFSTLGGNDIIMTPHSRDTVWVTPGQCYTVYDPGGIGDYYSSDTSTLVIRSTTGLGFRLCGYAEVSDQLSFNEDGSDGWSYYWNVDNYYHNGIAYITLTSNEAINSPGFAFNIIFFPTIHSLDTLWQNDTAMAITWQDTSASTQWTITYGTHIDSLRTITTHTRQATLTGLHRNAQCYINIESDFCSGNCFIPSVYGIRTPHDPDTWLVQYHNNLLANIGRYSLVESFSDIIPVSQCLKLYDNGGLNPPFPNNTQYHSFVSSDQRSFSIQGNYDLGGEYLEVNASPTSTSYGGIGNLFVSTNNDQISLYSPTSPSPSGEGFQFEVSMNYAIYQITASSVTCSTANLSWVDTSGASRWWIAYGEEERSLDTVTTTSRSYHFSNLIPDRQYVCYLWSNEALNSCKAPVKKCFITSCDTTLIIMPYNEDYHRTLNINECYTLLDLGGPNNYHYNGNQTIHLHSNTGDPMVLRGSAHICGNDHLTIYDEGTGQGYCWSWSGDNDNFEIHSNTGNLCIQFYSNGDTLSNSGFEFQVRFNTIGNIRSDLMTDSTCRIRWDDHSSANHWTFWYGSDREHMDSISTNSKTVHLENLVDGTHYYVFITNNAVECIDTTWYEFCAGGDNCIDYANLYSCHTQCRYGDFYYPDSYTGVIDYGPDNSYSRHTVMLDTSYRDPRTGGLLRAIPQGYDASVRLGNWNYGGEAESITYEYIVDTATADILLLRYAAVLENPGHQLGDQPRFQFSIVDEYDNPINSQCYSADFVSSDQLDWNTYQYDTNTVLWKDWTAVGIDLEPLQGRRIFVKLTTYDCAQTGHFGYAYFTLSCDQKYISSGFCGHVDTNNFTAPEGFRYQWYNIDSANVILDTNRVFYSSDNGIYRCRASFVGNTSSNCYFEKTILVGNIFPYADFSYRLIDTNECRVTYRFQNLSRVASDSALNNITAMECDSYIWDFGDGETSYARHPVHSFNPGYYNVHLTAQIAGASCSKDTVIRIAVPSPCIHYDTLRPVICMGDTFRLGDSALCQTGEYIVRQVFAPDSIRESLVFLTVNPVHNFYISDTLCTNQQYDRYDIHVPSGMTPDTIHNYVSTYQNIYSCDSTYHLSLTIKSAYDTAASAVACSDNGYTLFNTTVYESGNYIDSLRSIAGCDSVVHLSLTVNPAYHYYTTDTVCDGAPYYFHDSVITSSGEYSAVYHTLLNCDSTYHLSLTLFPRYDYYDTVTLCPRQPFFHNNIPYYAPGVVIDTFQTIHQCDSNYYTILNLNDTLFFPRWEVSEDTVNWVSLADTLWEGCSPFTLYFRNLSSHAMQSIWHFDDGNQITQEPATYDSTVYIAHTFDTGRYTFFLTIADSNGCTDTLFNPSGVSVLPSPTADFYWDIVHASEFQPWTTFHNTSIPLDSTCSSLWLIEKHPDTPDDLDSSSDLNPVYRWDITDIELPAPYLVWLIYTQPLVGITGNTIYCSDTTSDTVKIMPSTLEFPNFVTPNNDGNNDRFRIKNLIEYNRYPYNKLTIYDRWGTLVYEVTNISKEEDFWDPNQTNSPASTYYYHFVGNGGDGGTQHNGVIEVLRDK